MLLKQPLAKFAGVRVFARKACTNAARGATEYEASRIQVRLLPPSHSTCVAWSLVGTEAVNQAGSLAGGRVANTPQRQALVKRQVVPHRAPGQACRPRAALGLRRRPTLGRARGSPCRS